MSLAENGPHRPPHFQVADPDNPRAGFQQVGDLPAGGSAASNFYVQAERRLSPRGVMVMNFSGAPNRYITHIDRIRAAFSGSTLLVPVAADDNLLLFAFRRHSAADDREI